MTILRDSLVMGAFLLEEVPVSFGEVAGRFSTSSSRYWRPAELDFKVLIMASLGDSHSLPARQGCIPRRRLAMPHKSPYSSRWRRHRLLPWWGECWRIPAPTAQAVGISIPVHSPPPDRLDASNQLEIRVKIDSELGDCENPSESG